MRLIDADALKEEINFTSFWDQNDYCLMRNKIDMAPTVELTEEEAIDKLHETGWMQKHDKELTEQPTGEWINREAVSNTIFPFWERYECNQCHKFNGYSDFCPNCGAKMKGGETNVTRSII